MNKPIDSPTPDSELLARASAVVRIGARAVHKAQEESRRQGVPNVYNVNGLLYYELPSGELSRKDPYPEEQ